MTTESKCQTEAQSEQQGHLNAVGLLIGWQAARSGQPLDPSMGEAWCEGWRLYHWMHKTPSATRH